MAFKLKASSPLTMKIDEKLKFKEFDPITASKKVKYDPSGISILGKPINTYESDKARLANAGKPGYSVFLNNRAQRRVDAFTKAGGMSPGSIKATKEGRAGMAADTKARKNKTGIYDSNYSKPNLKNTPPKKTPPKKTPPKNTPPNNNKSKKVSFKSAYAKRDMKTYGNLSQSQFTAESKRQIASKKAGKGYDAPKKQMGKTPVVKPVKTQKGGTGFMGGGKNKKTLSPVNPKANLPQKDTTKTVKSKTVTTTPKETSKRASKLRAKGNAQLAAGDNKGALATRRKYDKKNKNVARKTKKGTNRVEYDESTGKGGSVLGNALRTVTGKRKRDKAAAEKRKNKKTVKATKPVVKAEKKEVVKKKKNERFMF